MQMAGMINLDDTLLALIYPSEAPCTPGTKLGPHEISEQLGEGRSDKLAALSDGASSMCGLTYSGWFRAP